MKRLHVHVAVADLSKSIRFYSNLFAAEPTVLKDDYAKWALEDPRVNFAISTRAKASGLDHLGIQVESGAELEEMNERLQRAVVPVREQADTTCCYARSNKTWSVDPDGIAWETFHTLASAPVYGQSEPDVEKDAACCVPSVEDGAAEAANPGCGSSTHRAACC